MILWVSGRKQIFVIRRLVFVDGTVYLLLLFLSLPLPCCPLVGMYASTLLTSGLACDLPWQGNGNNICTWHMPHLSGSFKCACVDYLCLYQPLMFYSPLWIPHALYIGRFSPRYWNGKTYGANWAQRKPEHLRDASQVHIPTSDLCEQNVGVYSWTALRFGGCLLPQQRLTSTRIIKWEKKSYMKQKKKILFKKPNSCWHLTFITCNCWTTKGRKQGNQNKWELQWFYIWNADLIEGLEKTSYNIRHWFNRLSRVSLLQWK